MGFSEAKTLGQGILAPESFDMWSMPVLISRSRALLLVRRPDGSFQVLYLLENVFVKPENISSTPAAKRA